MCTNNYNGWDEKRVFVTVFCASLPARSHATLCYHGHVHIIERAVISTVNLTKYSRTYVHGCARSAFD